MRHGLAVVAAGLGLGLLLAACAPLPVRTPGTAAELAAQATRERALSAQRNWTLTARFAASDGRQGGSGGLDWRQDGDRYRFTLRAPVTGKTVELRGGPEGAELLGVGRTPRVGADANSVLSAEFGWRIPVVDLAWWVRGLRAPGAAAVLTFGADGLPATLDQDGWHVEFKDWYAKRNPPLPRKVFASRDPFNVRLLIEQWGLPPAARSGTP
ncbi:MAG TPA: lipoprotein insertase outer membrane protein LolB [Rhodanobacteraceae bacterium]|nr:lipoprotein insertase outer membrane protein LolB [Rhodanobacteraceae bacterium]